MRNLLRAGSSAALTLAIMFIGSLVLWIGLPVGCLYLGSRVQDATRSLGAAVVAMMVAVVAGIVALGARGPGGRDRAALGHAALAAPPTHAVPFSVRGEGSRDGPAPPG